MSQGDRILNKCISLILLSCFCFLFLFNYIYSTYQLNPKYLLASNVKSKTNYHDNFYNDNILYHLTYVFFIKSRSQFIFLLKKSIFSIKGLNAYVGLRVVTVLIPKVLYDLSNSHLIVILKFYDNNYFFLGLKSN
ncbi:hypothetical protein D3C84_698020 [compost metagenome]